MFLTMFLQVSITICYIKPGTGQVGAISKAQKAEITCTKNIGQGRDSNPRPSAWQTSKILIYLYAQLTLVWQLKEVSL